MTRFRRLRFVLKWCSAGLIGMVLLLLCADWWLPSVLPTVLKHWDAQVGEISRVEGGRWECVDVLYEADGVRVSSDVVRVPSAWRTLQACWQGTVAESLSVIVGQLTVELSPTAESDPSDAEVDVVGVLSEVRAALSTYARWIPTVEIGSASIISNGAELLNVEGVSLRDWQLAGLVESAHFSASPVRVEAELSPDEAWRVRLDAQAIGVEANAAFDFERTDRVSVELSVVQAEETVDGRAVWLGPGAVPSEWSLHSDGFLIQRSWFSQLAALSVEQARVSDLELSWGQQRYEGHLVLTSELPIEDHESLPFEAVLAVSGDFKVLSVERCRISGPWGELALSNRLAIDLSERAVLKGAELTASIDLAKQAWVPALGHLEGQVAIAPDRSDGLDLRFSLNGKALSYGSYEVAGVQLAGEILGSTIRLDQLQLDLMKDTEADRVSVTGVADWGKRSMDLQYEAAIGADWLNEQLGEDYFADALMGKGRVFGSFDDPEMEGVLPPVAVLHPQLNPMTLGGEVRSLSEGAIDVNLTASCGGASILLDMAAKRRDGMYEVELEQLVISDPDLPTAQLLEPTRITYRTEAALGERLKVGPFHLQSEDSEVRVNWDAAQGMTLLLRNISSARMDRWLKRKLPLHQIDAVDVAVTQLRPNLLGRVEVHAQGGISTSETLRLDLVSRVDAEGIFIDELGVDFGGQSLVTGVLALPLRLQLPHEEEPLWAALPAGQLSGQLTGKTTAPFTEWLAGLADVRLGEAAIGLTLSGQWTDPVGALDVSVDELNLGSRFAKLELPDLTDLRLQAKVDQEVWQVEQFECFVNQGRVVGGASLPTNEILQVLEGWPETTVEWEPLLQHASGRLELKDWKFEHWRDRFPEVMRQSGELHGELVLKPGLDVSGHLVLDDFALRPTLAYSMIDQIGAEFELSEHMVRIKRASARVGGSPLSFTGWLDCTDLSVPLWELSAVGQRVPLVRTTDLILRSDLDLTLQRLTAEAVPELSGALNFTQSTLLVEFDPLAPSVESGPSSHPPYFSISAPSVADWKFDLVASGDSFLRVRSPYFRALISASLTLKGTFIKPELLGSLRVASGDILFPSVKMELDSGEAFIEQTRPNEVQLDLSGIAQLSSYVVTMEVGQTLSEPSVTFSSTPTLPNSQIVRLLATGGLSGGSAGAVGVYLGKGLLGVGAGGVDSSLSDRLTVDVGEAGGRDGGNTFGVKYRINDDLSLNSGYDANEEYRIDLLWSVFKR